MDAEFAAVGLGTGSEGTISRNALRVLREVARIYCPRSRNASSSHARRRLNDIEAFPGELIEYPLAMQQGGDSLRGDYRDAARRIAAAVDQGQSVAAVTVGDPSLYSTLGPLVEAVGEHLPEESIRTVPGISSIQTAASALGRPLVQHDEQFALIPLRESADLSPELLESFETLAFTKVNRGFGRLVNRLGESGRLGDSYLFERLGTDDERIVALDDLDPDYEPPYFSLVLSFEEAVTWN